MGKLDKEPLIYVHRYKQSLQGEWSKWTIISKEQYETNLHHSLWCQKNNVTNYPSESHALVIND